MSTGHNSKIGVASEGGVPGAQKCTLLLLLSSATDGEARTFNGSIELCRADSDSSQKVGSRESQKVVRGKSQLACGSLIEGCWARAPGLCLLTPHSCLFPQDRNGNQLRSPQEVRWKFFGRGDRVIVQFGRFRGESVL